ncbi:MULTISPECIES: 7-cyano-7-deazaguanine synthase QueC [Campylobacter]|uniref:7-cyano-7-deazaguanine synthase QueC n=1 Tax=Campylobacter TaxID=194 RepID=UPI000A334E3E|nr:MULTISPECIES: 7-cyano-7-deazaguanine synthase QueC [unclassified Campylobacter]MCR8695613.1 7-cyano-7-deazaguanine synthase QueC [Campylobacter sp. RM19073]
MPKALCIISGGMDSAVAAATAKSDGYEIVGLHFDYSQRTMQKERECFEKICDDLGVIDRFVINADFIADVGGNALTDRSVEIPKNSLNSTDMPVTYVPFRNGVFLSIAASVAQVQKCEAIYIGLVEVDGSGYPDCKLEFLEAMNKAVNLGTNCEFIFKAPLIGLSKAQIVVKAYKLGVDLSNTWSCYESGDLACGECDSCLLRLKGFKESNLNDPIEYKKITFKD